jgi:hypothetical protein
VASPSVLDLHFRIAGRIQNKEGTLVASFSILTAQLLGFTSCPWGGTHVVSAKIVVFLWQKTGNSSGELLTIRDIQC